MDQKIQFVSIKDRQPSQEECDDGLDFIILNIDVSPPALSVGTFQKGGVWFNDGKPVIITHWLPRQSTYTYLHQKVHEHEDKICIDPPIY